jgi:hypothetical protein
MGGRSHKPSLGGECFLEVGHHVVESCGELSHFIVMAGEVDTLA